MNTKKWAITGVTFSTVSALLFVVLIVVTALKGYTRLTIALAAMGLGSVCILGGCAFIGAVVVRAIRTSNAEYKEGVQGSNAEFRRGIEHVVGQIAQALRALGRDPAQP